MFFDGAHGWNIDIDAEPIGSISVLHFGEWKGLGRAGLHDARCWVLRDRNDQGNLVGLFLWTFFGQQSSFRKRAAGRKGYRPYFENYTVDASILNLNPSGSNYKDQKHMSPLG